MTLSTQPGETPAPPPEFFMVFDVESVGLHGEGYAVGWVVLDREGKEVDCGMVACNPDHAQGEDEGRAWVAEHAPTIPYAVASPFEVRREFWTHWLLWRGQGAMLVADCAWPVEARFLAACVDDEPKTREWQGPYPLLDLAPVAVAMGDDPTMTHRRCPWELPAHNPLNDARQSARLFSERLARLS